MITDRKNEREVERQRPRWREGGRKSLGSARISSVRMRRGEIESSKEAEERRALLRSEGLPATRELHQEGGRKSMRTKEDYKKR